MKKCSYCGKAYPDEASICDIDQEPLQPMLAAGVPPALPGARQIMNKQLKSIAPARAGMVLGIVYGFVGALFVPLSLLAETFGRKRGESWDIGFNFIIILFPILYAAVGFISGILGALVYNVAAKWTGGLEFEVHDLPRST